MCRIADLHPGNAKTDARDAYVIADAARTLPHTLRRVDTGELEALVGFDDELAGASTRASNRIRGLLTQIHPALERVLGPNAHPAVLELLSRCGGPAGLRKAGHAKLVEIVKPKAPRMGQRLVERIVAALDEQTVVVPGTAAAETILPKLADTLREVLRQSAEVATRPRAATSSSNVRSSGPRSRLGRTTTANGSRQETQRCDHLPGPPPRRCPARHAAHQVRLSTRDRRADPSGVIA